MKAALIKRLPSPLSGLAFTQHNTPHISDRKLGSNERPSSLEQSNPNIRNRGCLEEFNSWLTCRNSKVDIRGKLVEVCKTPAHERRDMRFDNSFEPEVDIEGVHEGSLDMLRLCVDGLRREVKQLESKIVAQKNDRQKQLIRLSDKLEKGAKKQSQTATAVAKEECLQFVREYVLECSNTLISQHQKDKKGYLELIADRCSQEYSKLKTTLQTETEGTLQRLISELTAKERGSLRELLDECSQTIDKFRSDQASIIGELLQINKETQQEFQSLHERIGGLDHIVEEGQRHFQQQQSELLEEIRNQQAYSEQYMAKLRQSLERLQLSLSNKMPWEITEPINSVSDSSGEAERNLTERIEQYRLQGEARHEQLTSDFNQIRSRLQLMESQAGSNAVVTLDKLGGQLQKLRQQFYRQKGRLEDISQELIGFKQQQPASIKQLTDRLDSMSEKLLSLENIDERLKEISEESASSVQALHSSVQSTFGELVQQYNHNFLAMETNSLEVMALSKEMIEVTSLLTKKLAEVSSTKLDSSTLETFFNYINTRVSKVHELRKNSQGHPKENLNELGNGKMNLSLARIKTHKSVRSDLASSSSSVLATVL